MEVRGDPMPLNLKESCVDWLVCSCGNEPHKDGFYSCLNTGEYVEPTINGSWQGNLYVCVRCFAIYDIDTFDEIGTADGSIQARWISGEWG